MTRWLIGLLVTVSLAFGASPALAQDNANPSSDLPACAADSEATPETDDAEQARPEWQTLELVNAVSGDVFTVSDFTGCTVLIETMATWCGSCFDQMTRVSEAVVTLDSDAFVVIALSVENGLPDETLAEYRESTGFDFVFTVASVEMLEALNEEFGFTVLIPPATPHIYVAPDGTYGELVTGGSSVDTILEKVESLTEAGTS